MKADKLRDLSPDELLRKEADLKAELFNLRFRSATGQLENPLQINLLKKDLARVKTIIRENQLKSS
ncbi:MAG: 50S ribosomal protein L29 [Clostridiales bacterium]|jgi:large subunit ribosomal protein L29|nr:50S ribosomal protein L29 [Clostridiales bacterium]MDR2711726.1 50S ribosomal protein L29 [Clostridiales bacterium]